MDIYIYIYSIYIRYTFDIHSIYIRYIYIYSMYISVHVDYIYIYIYIYIYMYRTYCEQLYEHLHEYLYEHLSSSRLLRKPSCKCASRRRRRRQWRRSLLHPPLPRRFVGCQGWKRRKMFVEEVIVKVFVKVKVFMVPARDV